MNDKNPTCYFCPARALPQQLTCGVCDETAARAEAHSARRGALVDRRAGGGGQGASLVGAGINCSAANVHVGALRCGLAKGHEGDVHRSGGLVWRGAERPRQTDEASLARLGPVADQGSDERLAMLTQVLITARAQMLGLATGLQTALNKMVRAVDQDAVRGLIGALTHIVQHMDSYKIAEGETSLRKGVAIGVDRITAGKFDKDQIRDDSAKVRQWQGVMANGKTGTLPLSPSERAFIWRGSVADLGTDIAGVLDRSQLLQLSVELKAKSNRMAPVNDREAIVVPGHEAPFERWRKD